MFLHLSPITHSEAHSFLFLTLYTLPAPALIVTNLPSSFCAGEVFKGEQ